MGNNETLTYIKQAFELKEKKYYKPAIEMFYKALELENDNIEILYQLGELYFLLSDNERALKYLEKVQHINPNHDKNLELIINIKQQQQDFTAALEIARKLYELNPKYLGVLISLLIQNNLYDELKNYENDENFTQELRLYCANSLYSIGKTELAKEFLQKCDPDDENVLLLEGEIKFDNNDLEGAKQIFSRIGKNTKNPEILNFLGLFALENMDFVEAIKYFSQASNIDKNNSKYFYNLGNAYFYNGWMNEAKQAYTKALFIEPQNNDYRYSLAYLYYDIKDFSKSNGEVDEILKSNPQYSQAKVLKALLLANDKNFLKAKEILEDNMKKNPDDDFTKISLCNIYKELNIFDKSKNIMQELIEKNPDKLNYLTDLSEIYIKEKEYDKALDLVNKILDLNPNYIAGGILGAKISYLKEDYEQTKDFAQDIISLDINCSEGYYYLALAREKTDDVEEAIECMKRAILYDLNNPKYYAKMSDFYMDKKDYKTALDYISEANNLDDTNEYKFKYSELVKLNHKKDKN